MGVLEKRERRRFDDLRLPPKGADMLCRLLPEDVTLDAGGRSIEDIIPISDLDEVHIQLPEAAVAPEGGRVIERIDASGIEYLR
jgi:hypothetical protein